MIWAVHKKFFKNLLNESQIVDFYSHVDYKILSLAVQLASNFQVSFNEVMRWI